MIIGGENKSLIFEELIEIAGEHSVIELSDFIGSFAVEALEMRVRGDDVDLPGSE